MQVYSPVTEQQLAGLDDRPESIWFSSALTDDDYALLGEWFAAHPQKTLRAHASYDGSITDLDFLRHFPNLRSFATSAYSLTSIDGLSHLPKDLQSLALGRTRKRLSLQPVARFAELESLSVEGQTKDIEILGGLTSLHHLTLRSITVPDLSMLLPLRGLRTLSIQLGGTKDLALLPRLDTLEFLQVWMVRGLSNISPVADLAGLEYLHIQALRHVTDIPDLSGMTGLRRLWIETLKGLTDLSPIRSAPQLRHLALVDMAHLQPDAFRPLVGHPSLETLRYGLGSNRKNDAVAQIIQLPHDGDWRQPRR